MILMNTTTKEILMNRRDSLRLLSSTVIALPAAIMALSMKDHKKRTVEVKTTNGWTRTEMKYLKPKDTFRMFEPTGEPVTNKKTESEWVVSDKPSKIINSNGDLVWGVKCE